MHLGKITDILGCHINFAALKFIEKLEVFAVDNLHANQMGYSKKNSTI